MSNLDHTPYAGFEPGFGIAFHTGKRLLSGMAHLSPKQAIQDFRVVKHNRQDGNFPVTVFLGILFELHNKSVDSFYLTDIRSAVYSTFKWLGISGKCLGLELKAGCRS